MRLVSVYGFACSASRSLLTMSVVGIVLGLAFIVHFTDHAVSDFRTVTLDLLGDKPYAFFLVVYPSICDAFNFLTVSSASADGMTLMSSFSLSSEYAVTLCDDVSPSVPTT